MSTSINTNIAAYYAQANIQAASNAAQSSIARLSSGNAIVNASDNVAALATGTSLATQVNALKSALTNASQGSSLLQVADGALAQIQSILQQQQSVALQAKSGSLTNTDRGFLNQQFQALANEINVLATGTTFNGVNLIDGSIATGGSSSSNPLQNTGIVANTFIPTATGYTDLTAAPTVANGLTGKNQANAGSTYFTGSYTGSGTGFTSGTTVTQPNGSYDKSLYGNLGTAGAFVTNAVGTAGAYTAYNVNYTAGDGTVYSGSIAPSAVTGTLTSGTITLTATTNAATHATIAFTVGATGFTTASDNSAAITAALVANTTGATYSSGFFAAAPSSITAPTSGKADVALRGDLSQGSFTIALATAAGATTTNASLAKGYQVTYTLNGAAYTGFLANDGTAGHLGIASGATLALSTGDAVNNSTINLSVGANKFGPSAATTVDQSANILSALTANFQGATALQSTAVVTVTGQTTQGGISAVTVTSDPTKNDNTLVGDLSKGVFSVSGSTSAGYNISYTLNGSTYQGNLSTYEIVNGGTLVLDNGTGSLAFTVAGNKTAPNSNTASSSALQTALTTQFAAATAHAIHTVATTLQSNGAGGTVAGSAVTAASTAGTLLDGFDGSKAQLSSALFGGGQTNLPPISNFTATGSGATTVFSVEVGGTVYSTQGAVVDNGNVKTSTFDGTAGKLNFYKNGDKTTNPSEVLTLDLTGIGTSAKIGTTNEVAAVSAALNAAFGGGGSSGSGGLTFQLGTTAQSNVTINIASAKTTALYSGAALDVSTQSGASAAVNTVSQAIDSITSLRAGVGAFESQFNFASAAIQSSVQTQDAARGLLLDTDISTESTAFATQQVKLQAGISVLAQANQQLQALLKLIG